MIKDFKDFALRGNVLDLAIGIVIGVAFENVVSSVVEHILMPILGILTGGVDFTALSVKVGAAELKYGMFIQSSITFLIVAFFLFMIVKGANTMKLKMPIAPALSSTDEILLKINHELVEIRSELKK